MRYLDVKLKLYYISITYLPRLYSKIQDEIIAVVELLLSVHVRIPQRIGDEISCYFISSRTMHRKNSLQLK